MELFKILGTIAVSNSEANDAIDETTKKASDSSKTLSTVGTTVTNVGNGIKNFGTKMLVVSAGIGGIGAVSINAASEFEASMAQVSATMGMTADEINNGSKDYERLSQAARDMGKATKFSANEAAEALNYLALAGYNTDEAIDLLPTILNLAASGGIDLAYASDMVTDAMSALGDTAGTAENFVDKMAKTSQKSNTSVSQLGEAILTVGGTAKNLAGGTTELNSALGILADNGIKGAEGGTALRNIILALSAPTDQASDKMEELGLQVYDAEGNMRPLNDVFNDLNSIMKTMSQGEQTEVLNTIFNKVDLKSANALLANSGDRFDELSGYLEDCDGAAALMAETMQNNLNGQLTTLKSALSEAAISLGEQLVPIIKQGVGFIQNLTDKFNSLSDEQKKIVIVIGLVVSAIAPLLIVLGSVISGIGSFILGIAGLVTMGSTGLIVIAAVIGLLVELAGWFVFVTSTIMIVVYALKTAWESNEEFREKVTAIFERLKKVIADFFEEFKSRTEGLRKAFENIINFLKPLWEGFCNFLAPIWEAEFSAIVDFVENVFNVILGLLDVFIGVFTGDWSTAWNGIKEILAGIIGVSVEDLENAGKAIQSIFTGIVDGIKEKMNAAKNFVKEVIENIKSFFKFEWSLPHLKMPHPTISGEFSLNPPSVPTFGIDWYAKGGVMNEPTAFGINPGNGNLMVGGEAGAEAIAPIETLQKYVAEAVSNQNAGLENLLEGILAAIIALDENMGGNLREAIEGTSVRVNNREFARFVKGVN